MMHEEKTDMTRVDEEAGEKNRRPSKAEGERGRENDDFDGLEHEKEKTRHDDDNLTLGGGHRRGDHTMTHVNHVVEGQSPIAGGTICILDMSCDWRYIMLYCVIQY